MAASEAPPKRTISRRQFLTLAGAGAVFGALVLAATRQKGVASLLKATTPQKSNQATAGKYITTSAPRSGPSLLQRFLSGKL
jgi:hypothetical protein